MIDRGHTYSEEFRAQCEAEYVCKIPSIADRREYLKGVQEKRGIVACNALKQRMIEVWNGNKK